MFFQLSKYPAPLKEYGIDIPLSRDRYQEVLNLVKKNNWPIHAIGPGDLDLSFLSSEFQKKIKNNPIEVIYEAYELVDPLGNYQRYNPALATRPIIEILDHHLHHTYVTGMAAQMAKENKTLFSFVIGGGLHHAHQNGPSGFCIVNDVALSALSMAKKDTNAVFWIIDVDAHRGDGTAAMTIHSSQIKSLSIHMQNSWPMTENKKEKPWHFVPSTCDIGLGENEEHLYLNKLSSGLDFLMQNFRTPDLVFIVQGSDAYYLDELPSTNYLKLDDAQILARDQLIFEFFYRKKIPQVYTMGGGYGAFAHRPYIQFLNWLKENHYKAIAT